MKIGVLCQHPVQYLSPLFADLANKSDLHVYYCANPDEKLQGRGFGVKFKWDTPLLSGYNHTFLSCQITPSDSSFESVFQSHAFDAFIVFGWSFAEARAALRSARRTRTPIFVRGDSQLPAKPIALQFLKQPLYRPFLALFSGFLSPGKRFDEYLSFFGVPRGKIFRCPHSVDNLYFERQSSAAGRPHRFGADPKTPVFLFCGKFIHKKRPFDFLKAIGMFKSEPVAAVMVGDGPLRQDLERYSQKMRLPVHFAGFVNQTGLPAFYSSADCLVLPSDGGETWGLVVNEAFASGLPAVVSRRAGCAPDLIDEGSTGYSFATGNINDLYSKMRSVAETIRKEGIAVFRSKVKSKIAGFSIESTSAGILNAVSRSKDNQ